MTSGAQALAAIEPPLRYCALAACRACPRLADHLAAIRRDHPAYHAAPVAPWGAKSARLLIVGLAPGMHGANRTGRPFTGDASGAFLFESLYRAGFATTADANTARLVNARITNAVRCLPPANRPTASEIANCLGYLNHELRELWRPGVRRRRCVLALGRIAHDAVIRAAGRPPAGFAHGAEREIAPGLTLLDTYHPSRQNTNTGRLTRDMLDRVALRAAGLLG